MATSRIRFYNIPDLTEDKNNIMEGLSDFLTTYKTPQLDIGDFQWQRLEMTKTIKINATQLLNTPIPSFMFNYCRIDTEKSATQVETARGPAFYFVESVEQEAKSTIKIYLKLDVLNTFYDQWKDKMTNGTYIARGHEDRFTPFLLSDVDNTLQLVHKFNRVSEGDTPPMHELEANRKTIYQSSKGDTEASPLKFYLIYRTAEDGRPCIDLAANRQLKIGAGSTGSAYTRTVASLTAGRYYYVLGEINFTLYGMQRNYIGTTPPWSAWNSSNKTLQGNGILIFWKTTYEDPIDPYETYDVIAFKFFSSVDDVNAENGTLDTYGGGGIQIANRFICDDEICINKGTILYESNTLTYDQDLIQTFTKTTMNAGTFSDKYMGSIDQLDKTDSHLVKVVECPYCPVPYTYNSSTGIYAFPSTYFANESELENPPFLRTYNLGKELPKTQIGSFDWNAFLYQSGPAATIEDLQDHPAVNAFLIDPKIYTSSYFAITLVYDSFAKQIKLEDYQHTGQNYFGEASLVLRYKQSANVSSALLFDAIPMSDLDPEGNFVLNRSEENFPRTLTASRNNEVALFSSEYLNYLKNGFNYDKKKLESSLAQQSLAAGLQAIGAMISFALAPATGGISTAAGVGLATGAVSSLANVGFTAMRGSDELAQKINLLKAQSYSVSSIDDLDLFNDYGKNKLQIMEYTINENDLNRIKARFQYYGYAVDKYANPWPFYFNGRHNFNYLKCDPVFKLDAITSIPAEYLDEIADKLRAGVTIWHSRFYLYNQYYNYALNKDYENMEESVLAIL